MEHLSVSFSYNDLLKPSNWATSGPVMASGCSACTGQLANKWEGQGCKTPSISLGAMKNKRVGKKYKKMKEKRTMLPQRHTENMTDCQTHWRHFKNLVSPLLSSDMPVTQSSPVACTSTRKSWPSHTVQMEVRPVNENSFFLNNMYLEKKRRRKNGNPISGVLVYIQSQKCGSCSKSCNSAFRVTSVCHWPKNIFALPSHSLYKESYLTCQFICCLLKRMSSLWSQHADCIDVQPPSSCLYRTHPDCLKLIVVTCLTAINRVKVQTGTQNSNTINQKESGNNNKLCWWWSIRPGKMIQQDGSYCLPPCQPVQAANRWGPDESGGLL